MKIENRDIEVLLIQLTGNLPAKEGEPIIPTGLLNFPQDVNKGMKGKLKRSLSTLTKEIGAQYNKIKSEQEEIGKIEDEQKRTEELDDLFSEKLIVYGYEAIPLSWLDDIKISVYVDTDFLISVGVLFDDTVKLTTEIEKKKIEEVIE